MVVKGTNGLLKDLAPNGSFGDNVNVQLTPIIQDSAQYGITNKMETFSATGGSVSSSNSMFICQTGTSVGGYGVIRPKKPVVYKSAQGIVFRGTAQFTAPVANSLQAVGLFNVADGLFFGAYGTQVGCGRRSGGSCEIRRLTVTGGSSGSTDATVTINSVAYTIPLTSGTTSHNAYQVAEYLIANQTLWNVDVVGAVITLSARNVGARSGTYSFSHATATASFSSVTTGVDHTYHWIERANWNQNLLTSFNPLYLNIFEIRFPFLGTGNIRYRIYDPELDDFTTVHTEKLANTLQDAPSLRNPSLRAGWISASLGSTTNLTVKGASIGVFTEGAYLLPEEGKTDYNIVASVGTSFTHIISIKCRNEFNGVPNVGYIYPILMTASTSSSKEVIIEVYKNPTSIGEYAYSYISQTNSIALSTKHSGTVSGGELVASFSFFGSEKFNLDVLGRHIYSGETYSIVAKVASGANSSVNISLSWKEDI